MPANDGTGRKGGVVAPFRRREGRGRTAPDGAAAFEGRIGRQPDMDIARVVRLHGRIAAGEYAIDARRTAEGLIRLESALDLKGKS